VTKSTILSAALVLAMSGAAAAQEGDPFGKAMDGAPPSGVQTGPPRIPEPPVGKMREADDQVRELERLAKIEAELRAAENAQQKPPAAMVPANPPAKPLAPKGAPPAIVPVSGPAGGAQADNSAEIDANYNIAEDTYKKILEQLGEDTGSIDKRIAANEEIVSRYTPDMQKTEDELRRVQVAFMNRAFSLRQQKETGQITEEQFQKAIQEEEGKWSRKKNAIATDATFFRDEVAQAQMRIVTLNAQKKAMEEKLAREGKKVEKKKAPGEALFEGLSATLDKLGPFSTRYTMDGAVGDLPLIAQPAAGEEQDDHQHGSKK
jgi:hypothetical protein